MNSRLKNILKYLLFLGIGGFLFYLAFRNTEFDKLITDFKKANYFYLFISMVMGYLAFVSRGFRWNLLLEPFGYKPKKWNSVHAVTIGYFANMAVPRAGELARCTTLYRTDKIQVNRLFGTVILERIIDFGMLLALVLITFILEFNNLRLFFEDAFKGDTDSGDSSGLALKIILAVTVVGGVLILYFFRHRFSHYPVYVKVREFWRGVKEGLKSFSMVKQKGWFIAHTLFIWLMYYLMVYVNIFTLEATSHLSASNGLFIMIVAGFGMVVPTPGGIGSYHYLVMLGMGVVGVASDDAVSFATLVHTGQLIMTLIAGLVALAAISAYRKNKKTDETITSPTVENI